MRNRLLPKLVVSTWSLAMITMGGGFFGQLLGPDMAQAAELGADCVSCHEQPVASFKASYHAKIWQGKNDCQSCHEATDKHANDPSKQNVTSFNRGGGRSAEELSQKCLGCHKKSAHMALWDMGAHKKNDVTCTACHDIHSPRSTVKQPTVCFGCHKDKRSDANKMSHHPVIEGKVKCSDCHNTHGTQTKGMLTAESVTQLCYKCHTDKRGPFIWEHPPVAEDCTICHTPHGSRHETLLAEKVTNLCQNCHDNSSHHDDAYDADAGFGGSASSNRFRGRACLECHKAIHGTNNFRRALSR